MFIKIEEVYVNVNHIIYYEYDEEYSTTVIKLSEGTIRTKESIESINNKLFDIFSMRIFHK